VGVARRWWLRRNAVCMCVCVCARERIIRLAGRREAHLIDTQSRFCAHRLLGVIRRAFFACVRELWYDYGLIYTVLNCKLASAHCIVQSKTLWWSTLKVLKWSLIGNFSGVYILHAWISLKNGLSWCRCEVNLNTCVKIFASLCGLLNRLSGK